MPATIPAETSTDELSGESLDSVAGGAMSLEQIVDLVTTLLGNAARGTGDCLLS